MSSGEERRGLRHSGSLCTCIHPNLNFPKKQFTFCIFTYCKKKHLFLPTFLNFFKWRNKNRNINSPETLTKIAPDGHEGEAFRSHTVRHFCLFTCPCTLPPGVPCTRPSPEGL